MKKETPVTDVTAAAVDAVDEELVRQLTERARAEGLQLTVEGGLLQKLTKLVMESALEANWTIISAMTSTIQPGATAATPATAAVQDAADRGRSGRDLGAQGQGQGRVVRAADRAQAAAPADRRG
jgi:hypothetical protein